MKNIVIISFLLFAFLVSFGNSGDTKNKEYLIIVRESVMKDKDWKKVVDALQMKHAGASTCEFRTSLREIMPELRRLTPRYVAIVDQPEYIGVDYIIDLNRMSREVDNDIYADFMYGIVTGYDARAALWMVNNSNKSLVIQSAVATIKELKSGKWFDAFAYVSDEKLGVCGEKHLGEKEVGPGQIDHINVNCNGEMSKAYALTKCFVDYYNKYDPDLIVTASHASEYNLEMPFSAGNIKAKDGILYADESVPLEMKVTEKPRVYLPIGNCLIGNVNNTKSSMAVAWMNSGHAAAMIGYIVPTWYGRAGWGGLKYWLTTPGRYTLSEAFFLNQQDMLFQINEWGAELKGEVCRERGVEILERILKRNPTKDEMGFFHDRDVLAIYGDPAWNVRLKELPEENDFTVTSAIKGKTCVITVVTKNNFSAERMAGDHFKEEHVLDLPFSYFFPERLKNPRLAKGQSWNVALDENFLLVYQPDFKPGSTYTIVLDIDK